MAYFFGKLSAYDAGSIDGLNTKGYQNVVTDGHYLYFVPYFNGVYHGNVLRFKLFNRFKVASSWDAYDAGSVDGLITRGFSGAVNDRRYIYFSPYYNGAGYSGIVLRLDTHRPFKDASSWDAFDAGNIDGLNTRGFLGNPVFDGTYVYFVPYHNGARHGIVLRYNTLGPFKSASSWDAYDAGNTDDLITKGYWGGVFDGSFVYFSPYHDGSAYHGRVLRCDTSQPFKSATSWSAYNLASIHSHLVGFINPATDGTYLYFPPGFRSRVLRYALDGPFNDAAYWESFDLEEVYEWPRVYTGCFFSNSFVLFVPEGRDLLGYDADYPFSDAGSWTVENLVGTDGMFCDGYQGVAGDGVYFYLAPNQAHPASAPAYYHGRVVRLRKDPCPSQLPPPGPGIEDLTTYAQDDYPNDISTSSSRATVTDLWSGDGVSCYKDYGPQAFGLELEIRFDVRLTRHYSDFEREDYARHGCLCLSNSFGSLEDGYSEDDLVVALEWEWFDEGYSRWLSLYCWGSTEDYMAISLNTTYYCTLLRTSGSSDTIQLKVYSDSARTNLLATLTKAGFGTKKWRYIYVVRAGNEGTGHDQTDFWIENVNVVRP